MSRKRAYDSDEEAYYEGNIERRSQKPWDECKDCDAPRYEEGRAAYGIRYNTYCLFHAMEIQSSATLDDDETREIYYGLICIPGTVPQDRAFYFSPSSVTNYQVLDSLFVDN